MHCRKKIFIAVFLIYHGFSFVQGQDIFLVVRKGDLAEVTRLIGHNRDLIHARNQRECMPLHYAAYFGHKEIAEYLIQKGADVNATSAEGETPLHYAVRNEKLTVAALLLEKGAGIQIKCIRGRTPLHVAARETGNVDIGKLLIENGAEINAQDNNGRTPLAFSAFRGFKEFVRFLLAKGVQVPLHGDEADDLAHKAAIGGHKELFEYMFAKGINLKSRSYYGGTLLHSAASGGLVDSMELLLQKGMNINAECRYGLKPIHYAAIEGKMNALEMLIGKGADIDTPTKIGRTPLDYAGELGHTEIADFLIKKGADNNVRAFTNLKGEYFGMQAPEDSAEIFAPGLISSEFGVHSSPAFSSDGKEVYWSTMDSRIKGIYWSKIENDKWTTPRIAAFSAGYHCANPVFSPDGNTLYFHSERPVEQGGKPVFGVWYVERNGKTWTPPKQIAASIGDLSPGWQVSLDKSNNMYFSTRGVGDIYLARYANGDYATPQKLGREINSEHIDGDPFVEKNAEFVVFASNRPGGFGGFDIYVAFRNENGVWEEAENIGNGVNSNSNELWPVLSPDGEYLFFDSNRNGMVDVYWINTKIIHELKSVKPE